MGDALQLKREDRMDSTLLFDELVSKLNKSFVYVSSGTILRTLCKRMMSLAYKDTREEAVQTILCDSFLNAML